MKVHHLTGLAILGVLVFIGLLSVPFLPTIEAVLTLPPRYKGSTASIHLHHPILAKMTGVIAPSRTPVMAAILAQDTFQRADSLFWGAASDTPDS